MGGRIKKSVLLASPEHYLNFGLMSLNMSIYSFDYMFKHSEFLSFRNLPEDRVRS